MCILCQGLSSEYMVYPAKIHFKHGKSMTDLQEQNMSAMVCPKNDGDPPQIA